MNLLGGLWKWVAAAAGVAASVLYAMWRVADAEKDKARMRADTAKVNRKEVEAARDVEHDVDAARAEARQVAEEVERENKDQRRSGDRPDRFGDDRLRDDED